MRVASLVAAIAPDTGKFEKPLRVFERGENLLQNGILNFAFRVSPLLGITFEILKLDR